MKQLTKFIITTMLLASALNAKAVILTLQPVTQTVKVGDKLNLDVLFDTEGRTTVGGVFSVNFDNNAFDFSSVNFDSSLPDDPFFRVFPTPPVSGNAFNLGFGNFPGIQGSGKVASLEFQAKKAGNYDFILNDPLTGHDPFSEGASYVNAQAQVDEVTTPTPPTPVPPTPTPTPPKPVPPTPVPPTPTPTPPTPVPPTPTPPSQVPLPATAWLLLSGIASFGLIARRKRSI